VGIIVCVVLGMTWGTLHNLWAARGQTDVLTAAVRTLTVPFVQGVTVTNRWIGRQVGWLLQGRTLARENERLRTELATLREENNRLREAEITAQRLRAQLGFKAQPPFNKIPADVIAFRPNPPFQTLLINVGSRDGIGRNHIVVAPEGLVGHVYDVAPTNAVVLLLTDSNSAVGAMVQRADSRAMGVCKGDGSAFLSFAFLGREADVRVGDRVISSGMGGAKGIFPKGLLIGTVTAVANNGSEKRVQVKPSVTFDHLEEVYVLR
jgi:rod shape-determining protein MreC